MLITCSYNVIHFPFFAEPSTATDETIQCYIHIVLPIKKASNTDRRYFNFIVQCKDKPRAVCFAPKRRAEINTLAQTKTAVKIENLSLPQNKQDDNITVKKSSKITTLDNIDFQISTCLSQNADAIMPLSSLPKLAKEQLVAVKAEVVQIRGIKRISSTMKGKLSKQEVVLRDTTALAKVIL